MSLSSRISDLATRIGDEIKQLRTEIGSGGGGASVAIDDTAPTGDETMWYQPSKGVFSLLIDGQWVDVGRNGVDGDNGSDGADGNDGADATASVGTGTVLTLTNSGGYYYNMASANSTTTYTTSGTVVGAFACTLINAATEPTVTGGTKIKGSDFSADTDMHLWVQYFGTTVQYFFAEL
jgi:hypothetical protein